MRAVTGMLHGLQRPVLHVQRKCSTLHTAYSSYWASVASPATKVQYADAPALHVVMCVLLQSNSHPCSLVFYGMPQLEGARVANPCLAFNRLIAPNL